MDTNMAWGWHCQVRKGLGTLDFSEHTTFPISWLSISSRDYFVCCLALPRFCLSFRDVEELLAQHGVTVSYEVVRQWCLKFGQEFARKLWPLISPFSSSPSLTRISLEHYLESTTISRICLSRRLGAIEIWTARSKPWSKHETN
jgi:hypothetical protein